MKHRNPYSDLGLMMAISVFVCILIKSLLFGFTWVSIVWLLLSCTYFVISWKYPSDGSVVKHSTTLFLLLSVMAVVGIALFDRKARPIMHAFEGAGDTIQEHVSVVEEKPKAPVREQILPADAPLQDTMATTTAVPDTFQTSVIHAEEAPPSAVASDTVSRPSSQE